MHLNINRQIFFIAVVFIMGLALGCNTSFADLSQRPDAGYSSVKNGVLKFKFRQDFWPKNGSSGLSYRVYDKTHVLVLGADGDTGPLTTNSPSFPKILGNNYFEILLPNAAFNTGDFYLLEVITDKNRKQYLRFQFN